ncbi:MAG: hypothetical protein U1B30_04105, partial [Pseudomonadota bacterium]|nr:hypothetical protein [Pseudomonadota bacterium]
MAIMNLANSFKGGANFICFQNMVALLGIRKSCHRLLFLMVTLVICGCDTAVFEWNEQVKLLSGEIIIVKRTAQQERSL